MTTTHGEQGSAGADIELHQLPRDMRRGERTIRLRHLASDDGNALLEFGRRQPNEDLLFQERDITNVADIGDWIHETEAGRVRSVVAEENGAIIGYTTIERGRLRWTRHVAEIRVMVDVTARRLGLGHILLGLAFESALNDDVAKIIAQMTPDQVGARKIFERLGFVEDAVLTRHVASGRWGVARPGRDAVRHQPAAGLRRVRAAGAHAHPHAGPTALLGLLRDPSDHELGAG